MEATRTSAAGIEVEDAIAFELVRLVSVAGDDEVKAGGFGLQIQVVEIVKNVEDGMVGFDDGGKGQLRGPRVGVHIAANGKDRSNLLQ